MKIIFSILLLLIISFSNSTLLFKLKSSDPYCLGGEFYENSVLVVKYKLFSEKRKSLDRVFPYLTIFIHNVNKNTNLNYEHILINKGKFTFNVKEAGIYEVCIQCSKYSVINELREDLFVNLKINSGNNDEDNLISKAINTQDVDAVNQKAKEIINLSKPIIEAQDNQLEIEKNQSLITLSNANLYKYLTFIQLFITFIIWCIQIFNFKRFLSSQHII